MSLNELTQMSNFYGRGNDYVIAGGGNTSWKTQDELYVKSSGQALATIKPEGFARMDRVKLAAIWSQNYPVDADERERRVLAALMAARFPGEETKRPSVETLLHDLMPQPYVVHTHPTLVNGLTCSKEGPAVFQELFGDQAVWIPLIQPGYILAAKVRSALDSFQERTGRRADLVFLQNHGLVVAGESPSAIEKRHREVFAKLADRVRQKANFEGQPVPAEKVETIRRAIVEAASASGEPQPFILFEASVQVLLAAADAQVFAGIRSAFTPDHIVYMGVNPIRPRNEIEVGDAWAAYKKRTQRAPRVILVAGIGAFFAAPTEKAAEQAFFLFHDALKIATYAESFGGPLFMTEELIDFILNWEVEQYRAKVS